MANITDLISAVQNAVKAINNLNQTVAKVFPVSSLTGSAVYNPPSIASGASASTTVTVTGAVSGDYVLPAFSVDLSGLALSGYISAPDTVTCVFSNLTAGAVDLASGTLSATVLKVA